MPHDVISLSEFKKDASAWIERLQTQPPVVLTRNGRGQAVVQSFESYQKTRDSLAMLTIAAQGDADIRHGRVTAQAEVFRDLRRELQSRAAPPAKAPRSRKRA